MLDRKIDPTNLSEKDSKILGKLLSASEKGIVLYTGTSYPIDLFEDGVKVSYNVRLKYPLYKETEKTTRVYLQEMESGSEAKMYLAGTVSVRDETAHFKAEPQHERLIKEFKPQGFYGVDPPPEQQSYAKKQVEKKSRLYQAVPYLRSKHTVLTDRSAQNYWFATTMHKLSGKSLMTIIDKESHLLTPEIRFQITKKFLEELKKLHDADLTHGDIKPGNVMVEIDYASNSVKSLKIIDVDLGEVGDMSKSVYTHTPWYKSVFYDPGKKGDIYAAGISLLEAWGVPGKSVRTYDIYNRQFKPNTKIKDPRLPSPIQDALKGIFDQISAHPDKRPELPELIAQVDTLELQYTLDKLKLDTASTRDFLHARDVGKEAKQILEKFSSSDSVEQHVMNLKEMLGGFTKKLEELKKIESPFAIMELTKILGVKALQACDDITQIQQVLNKNYEQFVTNLEAIRSLNRLDAEKFMKKIQKIQSIDELVEFNSLYSKQINLLIKSDKNKPVKTDLKHNLLADIKNAKTYEDLLDIYHQIKKYEKILKTERGDIFKAIDAYGITKTWQDIMKSFQQRALAIGTAEIEEKKKRYSDKVDFNNENQVKHMHEHLQERYHKFFAEKTGRVFQSSFGRDFDQVLQGAFVPQRRNRPTTAQ